SGDGQVKNLSYRFIHTLSETRS
ncbi:MAG: hypothetical protein JWM11_3401, partial [Planctomycetaceae bacterium]|nr:hypothetical protein [Planctomycetaceae bacterium]